MEVDTRLQSLQTKFNKLARGVVAAGVTRVGALTKKKKSRDKKQLVPHNDFLRIPSGFRAADSGQRRPPSRPCLSDRIFSAMPRPGDLERVISYVRKQLICRGFALN